MGMRSRQQGKIFAGSWGWGVVPKGKSIIGSTYCLLCTWHNAQRYVGLLSHLILTTIHEVKKGRGEPGSEPSDGL